MIEDRVEPLANTGAAVEPREQAAGGRARRVYSPSEKATRRRVNLTGLLGFALFGASWLWGSPEVTRWSLAPGVAVAVAGLLLRMWATGWVQKNTVLATAGPYAWSRNPLYLGTLLLALGQGLMSGLLLAPVLFPALMLAFYWPTMRQEERDLSHLFGSAFEEYRLRVPLLVGLPRRKPREQRAPSSVEENRFEGWRVTRCWKSFAGKALVVVAYIVLDILR